MSDVPWYQQLTNFMTYTAHLVFYYIKVNEVCIGWTRYSDMKNRNCIQKFGGVNFEDRSTDCILVLEYLTKPF
jgi:hypothetical protein